METVVIILIILGYISMIVLAIVNLIAISNPRIAERSEIPNIEQFPGHTNPPEPPNLKGVTFRNPLISLSDANEIMGKETSIAAARIVELEKEVKEMNEKFLAEAGERKKIYECYQNKLQDVQKKHDEKVNSLVKKFRIEELKRQKEEARNKALGRINETLMAKTVDLESKLAEQRKPGKVKKSIKPKPTNKPSKTNGIPYIHKNAASGK